MDLDALLGVIAGAALAGLVKFFYDIWGGQIAWKRELQTNTRNKIELQVPNYRLMSNYAEIFSGNLNEYLTIKNKLQLISIQPVECNKQKYSNKQMNEISDRKFTEDSKFSPKYNPVYSVHLDKAEEIAKISLFNVGKLFKILSKHFLEDGGDYFFPD
jgi:hypothetical protein